MKSITLNAYAKINLFLEVCDKRPDSYHNIDSVMQTVSLHDVITLSKADAITLSNNKGLPNNENNLAYKAAKLFLDSNSISSGVSIIIEKNIPVSAGLAGGSTDAAAVLKGLNELYETTMTVDELCALGSQIGADVPFCVRGGCMKAEGIGDVLGELPSIADCSIVISCPSVRESTPAAYASLDRLYNDFKDYNGNDPLYYRAEAALCEKNIEGVCRNMYNIFEKVHANRSDIGELKKIMLDSGACGAMMSGSGPSVFGIFKDSQCASLAVMRLEQQGYSAYSCVPVGKFAV